MDLRPSDSSLLVLQDMFAEFHDCLTFVHGAETMVAMPFLSPFQVLKRALNDGLRRVSYACRHAAKTRNGPQTLYAWRRSFECLLFDSPCMGRLAKAGPAVSRKTTANREMKGNGERGVQNLMSISSFERSDL